jgi:flavin reductase (DIM6/NTAB) family NADH-FMN oxidoreductase RutF
MERQAIAVEDLNLQPFTAFEPDGIVLVSGTAAKANPMTIGWGTFGIMWGRPVVMVMVRPTRHTWGFIMEAPDFTVNWLGEEYAKAVHLCGTKSGRDIDKFQESDLHPAPAKVVQSPVVAESKLVLECRKLYFDMLKPEQFADAAPLRNYPQKDYHGLFFGEVVAVHGISSFRR